MNRARPLYALVKYLHVLGAVVILGTGTGIAFFMLMAHRSRNAAFIPRTAAVVVTADMLFTATALVAQPLTGWLLMRETGYALADRWVWLSIILFGVTGLLWLPVVFIQIRMRDFARYADAEGAPLPAPTTACFASGSPSAFPGSEPS